MSQSRKLPQRAPIHPTPEPPTPTSTTPIPTAAPFPANVDLFRATFERASIGLALIDLQWRFSQVNAAYTTLLGSTETDLIGADLFSIIHPDDHTHARERLTALAAGSIPGFVTENRHLRQDGALVWAQSNVSLIRDGQGHPHTIVAVIEDITTRKHAEIERERLLEFVRAITTSVGEGVYALDANGRVTFINPAAEQILGWREAELLGKEMHAHIHFAHSDGSPYPQSACPLVGVIRDGRTVRIDDDMFIHRDGAYIPVSYVSSPLRVGDRIEGAVLAFHNISERQRLEQTLTQHVSELDAIFEAMADAVFIYNQDGRVVRMNAAGRDMLSIDREPEHILRAPEVRAARYTLRDEQGQILPPDRFPVGRILRGETLSGATAQDIMIDALDGRVLHLSFSGAPIRDANGHITGAVGVCHEVTERRRLERRTHETLDALLAMADTLVSGPTAAPNAPTTAPTGAPHDPQLQQHERHPDVERVLTLTQRALAGAYTSLVLIEPTTDLMRPIAVVGLEPEREREWWTRLRQAPLSAYAPSPYRERLFLGEPLIADLSNQPPVPERDYFGLQTVLIAPARLHAEQPPSNPEHRDAAPWYILSVELRDRATFTAQERDFAVAAARLSALMYERGLFQRERAEAEAQALIARKTNERMHAFLGIAGHELRTPVTSLRAGVQLAERAVRASLTAELPNGLEPKLNRAHMLLERADQQFVKLNRLIEDLLDITRISAGKLDLRLETDDLGDIVRNAVETQRLIWPNRPITLAITPDAPLRFPFDADRIEQVVTNYLANALKYSADDQPILVSVTNEASASSAGAPPAPSERHARLARIAVRDHGLGITPAALAQLWEPFQQVTGVRQLSGSSVGLGLGLSICKTIIERHGGQVGVESAPGHGSTFWFTLPIPATN